MVTGSKDGTGDSGQTQGKTCLFEEAGESQEGSPFITCTYIPQASPPVSQ